MAAAPAYLFIVMQCRIRLQAAGKDKKGRPGNGGGDIAMCDDWPCCFELCGGPQSVAMWAGMTA